MERKKQKIAFVYDAIFPYVKGGAQKRFYEIGRRLAKEGYEVHLYGMKAWKGPDVIEQEGMKLHGIMKEEPLYTPSGRRSIGEALRFGIACIKLIREPFDRVDCCGFPYFSLFPLRIITWMRRKPLYCSWHEVWGKDYWKDYLGKAGILGYMTEKLSAKLPDVIISVSENTTRGLNKELGRKKRIITLPNGIDLKKIEKCHPAEEESDLLFVGRLLAYKKVDILLEAAAIVSKNYPNISIVIIGEGPEKNKLEALAKSLQLEKNVRFFGFTEEENIFSRMKSSKVLVLPSNREGFGIVALEANACNLPVLTVDHPQNAAQDLIIESANGLVTGTDPRSIAKGIIELLEKRSSFSPKNGIEKYDWDRITEKIKEIFALNK